MYRKLGMMVIFLGLVSFMVYSQDYPQAKRFQQTNPTPPGLRDPSELETFLDGIMEAHMASHHIAGATLAAVKGEKIFLSKGYGFADVEKRKPVSPENTLFRPGSVSKLFTWTAVMQLVEERQLDLEADVNVYLDDFQIPDTFSQPITLTHLLTHTPGFEDVWSGMMARDPDDLVPLKKFLKENMPARIYPPGEVTAYSNYGSALAGYIVEKISGMPFEKYVEENIFKPLRMSQSTFRQPLPSSLKDYMSGGYAFENGMFQKREFELINGMAPAGALSASSVDMAKFMIAHLQNGKYRGKRILEEETARRMHRQLFTNHPRVEGNAYGFWERSQNNIRMIGHAGDTNLFHTLLILIPEHQVGFFVSYNSVGGGGTPREELLEAILDRYYPLPQIVEPQASKELRRKGARYTGHYASTRTIQTTFEKIGSLMSGVKVRLTEKGTLLTQMPGEREDKQWVMREPSLFQEVGGENTLVFKKNGEGRIQHMVFSHLPYFAFEKLAWYESPPFHFIVLILMVFVFLTTVIWPLGALYRTACRRQQRKQKLPFLARLARCFAGGMSGLFLIFLIGFTVIFTDAQEISYGVPLILKVLLALPVVSSLLALGVLGMTVLAWKERYWTLCGRIHFTLIFLVGGGFVLFLNYWNILGFWF